MDRTTNGKESVIDHTLKELKKFDVSYIFNEMGFNPIPAPREYFEMTKNLDIITRIKN